MISIPNVKEEQFQFVVQFLLDICCIPHVDKASINETYYEEVPVKTTENKDAKDKDKKDEAKDNNEKKDEAKEEQKPEPPKTEKKKRERNNVCMLKIAECTYGNPKSILDVRKNPF